VSADEVVRVGVLGAGGKVGSTICAALSPGPADLELVASVGRDDLLDTFTDARCDVVVDFSTASVARHAVVELAGRGMHVVVGTSGLDEADLAAIRAASERDGSGNVIVAANFAVSAALMMRFAELAAPFFDTVEVVEMHHDAKVDAPSGTAVVTAQRIAAASGEWAADPTRHEVAAGARGATVEGIAVHSVRMRGAVAHQQVIFGAVGQMLTIRQDSTGRDSYVPGVFTACRRIATLPGLTLGLDAVLGL
jgi:4-hydroxy-tetrahydrodipicolinate reductase